MAAGFAGGVGDAQTAERAEDIAAVGAGVADDLVGHIAAKIEHSIVAERGTALGEQIAGDCVGGAGFELSDAGERVVRLAIGLALVFDDVAVGGVAAEDEAPAG